MQMLTLAIVKEAAMKAYKEERLTAQARSPHNRVCKYKRGDHVCAIGAALDPDTLELVAQWERDGEVHTTDVTRLCKSGLVDAPAEDINALVDLQSAHDDWCTASPDDRDGYRADFVTLLEA